LACRLVGSSTDESKTLTKLHLNNKHQQLLTLHSSLNRYLPLILLFILGYYLLMTIGEKKQDRYFLPAYPWLNLLAAIGLVGLASLTSALSLGTGARVTRHVSRFTFYATRPLAILTVLILAINGPLVITNYPYYFTYYNPLLGGIKSAAKAVTIGWGEGLDLAADYLNKNVDTGHTRVSSWYQSTFAPYYRGPAISYSKEKGKALAGDYVIFYINQAQRRFPDDVMFDYFESRFAPEKTITLHGVDYAWVYPSLGVDHYVEDQTYTGIASLLAWQWEHGDTPLVPGQSTGFDLYWEYLGKEPGELFFLRLVDRLGNVWAEGQSRPLAAKNPPFEQWRQGEIIVEQGTLALPPDIPPGQYRLQIGFYTNAPAVTSGELLFTLPPDDSLVQVGPAGHPDFELPAEAVPVSKPLGQRLTLLGAVWPQQPVAQTETIPLELYWQVEQPLPANFQLHLGLMDEAGEARQAWFNLTLAETFNAQETTWPPGTLFRTRWQLDLLPDVPPGDYRFELVLAQDTEVTLPFGRLTVSKAALATQTDE